jgi:hypothetical protein
MSGWPEGSNFTVFANLADFDPINKLKNDKPEPAGARRSVVVRNFEQVLAVSPFITSARARASSAPASAGGQRAKYRRPHVLPKSHIE